MKKSPLKRNKGINPISDKGKGEIKKRRELKDFLILRYGNRCMRCNGTGSWIGIDLSHKILRSRGGKTSEDNCELLCRKCHGKEHGVNYTFREGNDD